MKRDELKMLSDEEKLTLLHDALCEAIVYIQAIADKDSLTLKRIENIYSLVFESTSSV